MSESNESNELPETPESSTAFNMVFTELVLVVDDNPANLKLMARILKDQPYRLLFATSGAHALQIAQRTKPALVLLDIMMPEMDGFEVCQILRETPGTRECAIIFLSALDDTASKVKGFGLGASDFISKPFQAEEVLARLDTHMTLQRLQMTLRSRNVELRHELQVARHLLDEASERVEGPLRGESLQVQALREAISNHAMHLGPVALEGPPGAGQESTARAIHQQSSRRDRPFIRVNCALLSPTIAARLLQTTVGPGEEDPDDRAASPLWLAHRGTLYLEQFDALPAHNQREWGTLLDEHAQIREAGRQPSPDIRLVASIRSKTPLPDQLRQHRMVLPALDQRKADIPAIARFFLSQTAQYLGKVVQDFTTASLQNLQAYHWPGNVRELQGVIEREVTLAPGEKLVIPLATLQGNQGAFVGGYQLEQKLGEGGMGEVWQARHQLLTTPAAIKFIRFHKHMDEASRQAWTLRFTKEAQVTAKLQSPYTVRLYDYGIDPTGTFSFYYVMELLQGIDLEALVVQEGPLPLERVISMLMPVCRSLAEAHAEGLIHRDIKPSNIFICALGGEYDFPKVLDFGVVKDTRSERATLDNGEFLCGTPGYIPPEQLNDDPIDERADIYSLGCVAFWAVTGRLVFDSQSPVEQIMRHTSETPPKPSQFAPGPLPPAFDQLILRCLSKQSSERPNATEFCEALDKIVCDTPWTRKRAADWWQPHLTQEKPAAKGDSGDLPFYAKHTLKLQPPKED